MTADVATLWYRPPEILFGSKQCVAVIVCRAICEPYFYSYNASVDMWSCGCILGEMLSGKPIFAGASTFNQIEMVLQVRKFPHSCPPLNYDRGNCSC